MCYKIKRVKNNYSAHLDAQGRRNDLDRRPELTSSSVEIVAPEVYTSRQPMPPVYVFVIDVSVSANTSGMLADLAAAVSGVIEQMAQNERTRIGFVTFDSTVHFYTLRPGSNGPQMLVCADISDVFLPSETDLLVNLSQTKDLVMNFLASLPEMHKDTKDVESALGPALDAASRLMANPGGKMLVFLSALPSLGLGRLSNRENVRLLGTEQEHKLLRPHTDFYRKTASQFVRYLISVNLYLFSELYTDVASLAPLAEKSAGQVNFYRSYDTKRDGEKFRSELQHDLTRPTGWEAVLRLRVSQGLQIKKGGYHGAYIIKKEDLLELPVVDSDKSYTVELLKDEKAITSHRATIQVALLYTTSWGERRIRVHTTCIPVVPNLSELYKSINVNQLVLGMTKMAVKSISTKSLNQVRTSVRAHCQNLLTNIRKAGQVTQDTMTAVAMLPMMTLALLKSRLLRGGTSIRPDTRAWLHRLVYSMDANQLDLFLRPRFMNVTALQGREGLPFDEKDAKSDIKLPAELPLSEGQLVSTGAFLLDDGLELLLWIGEDIPDAWEASRLDVENLTLLQPAASDEDSDLRRLCNIVDYLRQLSSFHQQLTIIRQGQNAEQRVLSALMLDSDSANRQPSYDTFIQDMQRKTGLHQLR